MHVDDIATTLPLLERVETESREVRGLDLLCLRVAAESVSLSQLNSITTITPTGRR